MKLKYKKWNKRKIRQTLLNYKSLKEAKLNNQDALDSAKHRGSVFYKKVTKHLKKEVLPQEKDYVENCLIPLLHSILKKHKQIYNITHEAHFKHNNKHYFIDILIIFPKHNKIIPIEFKHTDKQWQLKSIKSQIQKYNNYFLKSHKSTVFLLSQNGKYGISEKDFIQILILFIRTNRLKKPIYNFDKK